MEFNFDTLKRTFERLTNLGLLERIFSWGKIKSQLIEANGELQRLLSKSETLRNENLKLENSVILEKGSTTNLQQSVNRLESENSALKVSNDFLLKEKEERVKEISTLAEANKNYLRRGTELSNELSVTKSSLERAEQESKKLKEQLTQSKSLEDHRKSEYEKSVSSLNQIQQKVQRDREEEVETRSKAEVDRVKKLKETWSAHELNVKKRMVSICSRHMVDYVDKVPFKG